MDEYDQILLSMFDDSQFVNYWHTIDNAYKELGLGDGLSDEDRIKEYVYITQQLRKFVSTHKDQILQHGKNYVLMIAEIDKLNSSLPEWDESRQATVYCVIRNAFLQAWANTIYQVVETLSDVEEE